MCGCVLYNISPPNALLYQFQLKGVEVWNGIECDFVEISVMQAVYYLTLCSLYFLEDIYDSKFGIIIVQISSLRTSCGYNLYII